MVILISIAVAQSSVTCLSTPEPEPLKAYQLDVFIDPDKQTYYICQELDIS